MKILMIQITVLMIAAPKLYHDQFQSLYLDPSQGPERNLQVKVHQGQLEEANLVLLVIDRRVADHIITECQGQEQEL